MLGFTYELSISVVCLVCFSGADFGMYSQPMRLSSLQDAVESFTRNIFNAFLDFPKPIIACTV